MIGEDHRIETTTAFRQRDGVQRADLGTISRLENLTASIPARIDDATKHAAELKHTISQTDRILGRPFQQAADLVDTRRRYAE
jgi:hypothetical protein